MVKSISRQRTGRRTAVDQSYHHNRHAAWIFACSAPATSLSRAGITVSATFRRSAGALCQRGFALGRHVDRAWCNALGLLDRYPYRCSEQITAAALPSPWAISPRRACRCSTRRPIWLRGGRGSARRAAAQPAMERRRGCWLDCAGRRNTPRDADAVPVPAAFGLALLQAATRPAVRRSGKDLTSILPMRSVLLAHRQPSRPVSLRYRQYRARRASADCQTNPPHSPKSAIAPAPSGSGGAGTVSGANDP